MESPPAGVEMPPSRARARVARQPNPPESSPALADTAPYGASDRATQRYGESERPHVESTPSDARSARPASSDVGGSGTASSAELTTSRHTRGLPSPASSAGLGSLAGKLLSDRLRRRFFGRQSEGEFIGRYQLVELLGAGGMGMVFTALDRELRRQVALKVVHEHLLDTPRYRRRMLREAQAMARLSHPNVVHVYEVGEHGAQIFIAMELVSGCTMRSWLAREPRSVGAILDNFIEAGRGLAAAHAVGLVHRDFKPDNVLVGEDGRVRVTDFGVAQVAPLASDTDTDAGGDPTSRAAVEATTGSGHIAPEVDTDEVTRMGAIVGTAAYMSPEQMCGEALDARSDLFALCVALYEALYGERPFAGESLPQLIGNVTEGRVRPAPADADVPARLRRILLRGLAVDPADRYPCLDAIVTELEEERDVLRGQRVRGPGPSATQVEALREAGYELEQPVREQGPALWVRAEQRGTRRPVLVKLMREGSSPAAPAQLAREHEVLCSIEHPRVVHSEGLVFDGEAQALVVDAPMGVGMRALVGSPLCRDLGHVLRIASSLTEAIQAVHAAGYVHGGISPDALLVDLQSMTVMIADVDAAVATGGRPASETDAQPGRSDAGPDPRIDHLGLGLTLHTLLLGQEPDEQPVTAPQAEPPQLRPVHIVQPEVPVVVSQLVQRLLGVDPQGHYQSLRGILADLRRCLRDFEEHGEVPPFPLGTEDVSVRFIIPEQLYGRQPEQRRLEEAFERAQQRGGRLALVTGPSGIGKTALARDLEAHVARCGGRVIVGKFDQVGSDVPYDSLVQAFSELFERLAVLPPAERERLRERLREALDDNLGVIATVVPAIRTLVGPTRPVPAVPPSEAAHRFLDSFRALLSVLARPEHPLVVFLDDLQWSDASTMRLVASLAADPELRHLLWIGAYRDDEVGPEHPVTATVRKIEADGGQVDRIEVGPIDVAALEELLSHTLSAPRAAVTTLAQLCHAKADGNPFFARALLQSLHQQQLVYFDPALEQWGWDVGAIDSARVSDDVVELMEATLVRLPGATVLQLQLAACIGSVFATSLLAEVSGTHPVEVERALEAALTRGLISARGDQHYAFAHDRIQQAAYAGLDADARVQCHLRIGRRLWDEHGSAPEWLFTIVNHLQVGLSSVTDAAQRARIAQLLIEAGRGAKAASAYAESAGYFRQALRLLPADPWSDPTFETCFVLHQQLMEVEYLDQNPEGSAALFVPLMEHARTDEQRAEIYELRANLESSMGHHSVAMDLAARGLKILGVRMPGRGSKARVLLELWRVKRLWRGRSVQQLERLPEVSDPRMLLVMRLLIVYSTSGYFVDSTLLSVGMMRITRLTLRHGLTDASAFGFAGFAMVLSGALGRYSTAAEFGQLALRLNQRFGNVSIDAKLQMINGMFLLPWVRPFGEVRAQLDRACEVGQHNGDLAYASYSATTCATVHALEGVPLPDTIDMTTARLPAVRRTLDDDMASIVVAVRQMSECFMGRTLAPPSFSSPDFDESEFVAGLSDEHTPLAMYYYRLAKLVTCVHFRCLQPTPQLVAELHPRLDAAFGNPTLVDVFFYECMASAQRYGQAGVMERARLRRAMRRDLRRLGRWAQSCPDSYEARHLLAKAEFQRVARGVDPLPLYTRAIVAAHRSGTHQIEGLGYELAAEYSAARGHALSVPAYVDKACAAFERWGASARVRFVRERFASFTPRSLEPSSQVDR